MKRKGFKQCFHHSKEYWELYGQCEMCVVEHADKLLDDNLKQR